MKVCDLTQAYTSASGGIRTYIDAKREYIKKHTSWQHVLIIPGERNLSFQHGRLKLHEILAPPIPKCEPYRFTVRMDRILSILCAEKPDIIEFGSAYILPWTAFAFRKLHPCAVVGFYHTDFSGAYAGPAVAQYSETAGRCAEVFALRYTRAVYRRCDATFTASKLFYHKLRTLRIPNVQFLPLGVDLNIFNPAQRDEAMREQLGLTADDRILVYVGRFDAEKHVHMLAEAYKRLQNKERYALLLIGDGPLKSELQRMASSEQRIFFFPFQRDKINLARLLASADIYVTAGPHETFGLSVLEAQASGLPVVGVRGGALPERVPAAVGLLGAVDSPEEMASHISALSEQRGREMGAAARRLVQERFSWERSFAALFELYETAHAFAGIHGEKQAARLRAETVAQKLDHRLPIEEVSMHPRNAS